MKKGKNGSYFSAWKDNLTSFSVAGLSYLLTYYLVSICTTDLSLNIARIVMCSVFCLSFLSRHGQWVIPLTIYSYAWDWYFGLNGEPSWDATWYLWYTIPTLSAVESFFTDTKWNRPVYLAISKRSMACSTELAIWPTVFTANKHWMICVEAPRDNYYYIFHAKGSIPDLVPTTEIWEKDKLEHAAFGFYRLGATCKEAIKEYARKKYERNIMSCQQYTNICVSFLCQPFGYVCLLTKFYGRVYFLSIVGIIAVLSIPNYYLGLRLPLEWLFLTMYCQDAVDEEYRPRPIDIPEVRQWIISIVVFSFFRYFNPLAGFHSLKIPLYILYTFFVTQFTSRRMCPEYKHSKKVQ